MPFADFVKTTVLLSAARGDDARGGHAAQRARRQRAAHGDDRRRLVGASRRVIGVLMGRRAAASPPIARLLARRQDASACCRRSARCASCSRGCGRCCSRPSSPAASRCVAPQIPAVATGFAMIWALAWRQQHAAIVAIERRDGVRFYVDQTLAAGSRSRSAARPGFKAYLPTERRSAA